MFITLDGLVLLVFVVAVAAATWMLLARRRPDVPMMRRLPAFVLVLAALSILGFTVIRAAITVSVYEVGDSQDWLGLGYTLIANHLLPFTVAAVLLLLSRLMIGKPQAAESHAARV